MQRKLLCKDECTVHADTDYEVDQTSGVEVVTVCQLLNNQTVDVQKRIELYWARKNWYLEQFEIVYKEYRLLLEKQKKMNFEAPINYLTNGSLFKGYNASGKLVVVFDKYGDYAVIEYEKYFVGVEEKRRIARVYDKAEKQVVFAYNNENSLSSITDINGAKTQFLYNTNNKLIEVKYDNGYNIELAYFSTGEILSWTEKKNRLKTTLSSASTSMRIANYSLVDQVSNNEATGSNCLIETIILQYIRNSSTNEILCTTITNDATKEIYFFETDGNCCEYALEEGGKITKAEQYEFVPYWSGETAQDNPRVVTRKAKKTALYRGNMSTYIFPLSQNDYDVETTTLNQFNQAVQTTTNPVRINVNGSTKMVTVDYIYDDNQRLIEEKVSEKYSFLTEPIISHTKYNYDRYGNVSRGESYVEGEEYTLGKFIKETVYDEKGYAVESFAYNSLDSSSKFYTTTESSENGGKFAYGYDADGTVTAITQSTEDGEENSTQRVYTCGMLTQLRSGNTEVKYSYDYTAGYKYRKESICLNGVEDYVKMEYSVVNEGSNEYNQVLTTNANGETSTVRFDKRGNVYSKTYSDGTALAYEYTITKGDQLKSITETQGNNTRVFSYTYDAMNNVQTYTETQNGTAKVSETYAYDMYGAITNKAITVDNQTRTYSYAYEGQANRRLAEISVLSVKVKPQYDVLNRNKGKELYINNVKVAEESIAYRKIGDHATNMPSTIWFGDKSNGSYQVKDCLKYAYDKKGNIEKVYENGALITRYVYDNLNRLIREDSKPFGVTWVYSYDNNGNILYKRAFDFTLRDMEYLEEQNSIKSTYKYEGDALVDWDGELFAYDTMGNPTTYRGMTAVWQNGRQLIEYDGNTFTYDAMGRRIQKNDITFTYDSQGRLIKQSNGLEFVYDHTGVVGVIYNTQLYLYQKDIQGNIISLLDNTGRVVVKYTYDAWGNHAITVLDAQCEELGSLNPFRYRGYYYDDETCLYYLKTRYYDPEICRFITADSVAYLAPNTINGLNLYAYCGNNPVMRVDPNGTDWNSFWEGFGNWIGGMNPYLRAALGVVVGLTGLAIFTASLPFAALPFSGYVTQAGISMAMYGGFMFAAAFNTDVENDMNAIGWNPFNTDTNAVLNSGKVSFYKGVPVVRTNWNRSGSFGIIFLRREFEDKDGNKYKLNDPDEVRHERGHNTQLMVLGGINYAITVGIPSLFEFAGWSAAQQYYYAPWETMADIFGGVTHRYGVTIPQQQITNAWTYFYTSLLCIPFVVSYWI